jgi:hypothetical protein
MKKTNYLKSVQKWRGAIRSYKKAIKDDDSVYVELVSPCGFCKEFSQGTDIRYSCNNCPLFPEFCTSGRGEGTSIFWQIVKADNSCDFKTALTLSEKMLAKIETYNPAILSDKETRGKE